MPAPMAIAALFMATFGSALYFLSIYFQDVLGYDALETGTAFLLPTAVVVAGSMLAGRLATRVGLKRTLMGHQVILPVTAGKLDLGPWEQVFYAEFDGQRRKRVVVKVMGE